MLRMTEETWLQGSITDDSDGTTLLTLHKSGTKQDLYGALRDRYTDDEEFYLAINKVKGIYKILFRDKWDACKNLDFWKSDGRRGLVYCMPLLWRLNDELDNFSQVKQILLMLE